MAATMLASRGIFLKKLNFNYPLLYCYSSKGGKGKKASDGLAKALFDVGPNKSNRKEQETSKNESENADDILSPRVDIGQQIAKSNAEFKTQEKTSKSKKKKSTADSGLGNILSTLKTQSNQKTSYPSDKHKSKSEKSADDKKANILRRMLQPTPPPKPKPEEIEEPVKPVITMDDMKLSIRETKKTPSLPQTDTEASFIYFVDKDAPIPEEEASVETVEAAPAPVPEIEEYVLPVVEEDTESFATLMRNSKLMQIASYKSRVVSGTIFNIIEDDMYIDFGGKFHCVCKKPAVEDTMYSTRLGKSYVLGKKVKVRINDLEMTSKFLGSDRHVTILEADATLIGLQRMYNYPYEFKSVFTNPDSESVFSESEYTTTDPESVFSQWESTTDDPESVFSQSEFTTADPESVFSQSEINEMETDTNDNGGDKM